MADHNVSATAFGDAALGDRHFVRQLRAGRRVWPETEAKVRTFMAAYVAPTAPEPDAPPPFPTPPQGADLPAPGDGANPNPTPLKQSQTLPSREGESTQRSDRSAARSTTERAA